MKGVGFTVFGNIVLGFISFQGSEILSHVWATVCGFACRCPVGSVP